MPYRPHKTARSALRLQRTAEIGAQWVDRALTKRSGRTTFVGLPGALARLYSRIASPARGIRACTRALRLCMASPRRGCPDGDAAALSLLTDSHGSVCAHRGRAERTGRRRCHSRRAGGYGRGRGVAALRGPGCDYRAPGQQGRPRGDERARPDTSGGSSRRDAEQPERSGLIQILSISPRDLVSFHETRLVDPLAGNRPRDKIAGVRGLERTMSEGGDDGIDTREVRGLS